MLWKKCALFSVLSLMMAGCAGPPPAEEKAPVEVTKPAAQEEPQKAAEEAAPEVAAEPVAATAPKAP